MRFYSAIVAGTDSGISLLVDSDVMVLSTWLPVHAAQRSMALVGTLFARLLAGGRGLQESQDVWKLYHLLHYFQQCGGMEVRVARPRKVSPRRRYSAVHAAVTAQVAGPWEGYR